jgi:hypothetical protein
MSVEQRDKFFEVVLHIEGNSDRPWSFSESYALKSAVFDPNVRKQCNWLAQARANCLNNDCQIDIVQVTEWPKKRKSVIINDKPFIGQYHVDTKALGMQGNANIDIIAGATNPAAGSVGTIQIPKEEDLDINNPQSCMNFYLEGADFHSATRQFSAIPDIFIHDLRASALPDDQTWLFDPAQPPTVATPPLCKANFYENIKVFWEAVRTFCVIPAQTSPKDPAKRDLCSIERVVYRGIGQRPVGSPKKLFRGRHAIPQ